MLHLPGVHQPQIIMFPNRLQLLEEIKTRSETLAAKISAAATAARNEWEFRRQFANLVEALARELGIPIDSREEYTIATGRVDAAYNRVIIEYKDPGTLRTRAKVDAAVQQLRGYLEGIALRDNLQLSRLFGVVTDGRFFIFVRQANGLWSGEPPVAVNTNTTARFLKLLFSLVSGKALSPQNLADDFGSQNDTAPQVTQALYNALGNIPPPLVKTLFNQWVTFFGEVTGYEERSAQLRDKPELQKFAASMGLDPQIVDPPHLFFAVHTYFALLIKFIAFLALSQFVSRYGGMNLSTLGGLESGELRDRLREMERGGLFRTLGIRNFLEADFFGWYLETWNPEVEAAIRGLINRLADYDPGTLEVSPEQTRDLLKKLYHTLMPRELRHDLGEYYTPDWLAQRVLDMLEAGRFRGDPRKKILDPACGSGTFLVLAIQRIKANCVRQGLHERDTLEAILEHVVGIDLNPLAVIAARTNYLLALGDLLAHRGKEIDLPVYLADSIVMPAEGEGLFGHDQYPIKTAVGPFFVPSVLRDREQIEILANQLEKCIESEVASTAFLARLQNDLALPDDQWQVARPLLEKLYEKFKELHSTGHNGIWSRILKNAFMPLFLKDFDYIVGNPPLVNWESLPEEYRQDSKKLWVKHGLFPHGGMDTILGKGKKDISMLMTYEAMDSYLKDGGKLAFVITQSVFKTSGAGQGFRRFILGSGTPIKPVFVDDLSSFQCFEGATNRTAVVVLQKGQQAKYPVTYNFWQKTAVGKSIGYDSNLEEVKAMTRQIPMLAGPVNANDPTSSWLTARPKALKAIRKVLGRSDYTAYAGVYSGGANGVFWLEILEQRPDGILVVRNLTEGAKRDVEQVTTEIEPDLVYPMLRGRDVQRWRAVPSAYTLMVQNPKTRRGIDEATLQVQYPRTWAYLKRFEPVLRQRAAFKRYFTRESKGKKVETGAFYSMFNIGDYTFSPYKVVWREQSASFTIAAVFPADKIVLPDHKLMMVPLDNKDETYYLLAILNSAPVRFGIESYNIAISTDTHILNNIKILKYNQNNTFMHQLSIEASKIYSAAGIKISDHEKQIDLLAAELFNITQEELKDIHWNLADLQGGGKLPPIPKLPF
ncbi:MAG: N-6 DNA methylase [Desulfobaccales bacterium]